MLSYEFCEIFKNPFLQNTSARLLLDFFHSLSCVLPPVKLIETRFFLFLNMFYHGFWTWWISRTLHSLYFAKQMTQLLLQGNSCCCWNFCETPRINLHWISVLHYLVILHIKVTEAVDVMWFTDSEVFFKQPVFKHVAILTSGFTTFWGLSACTFIKKRLQHRCFPVNIAKFYRATISKNIRERLLLKSE